jgi:ABC-type dipeptide/oligopeptide/nickel transport system permease subunit
VIEARGASAPPEGLWRLTLRRIRRDRWTLAAACLLGAIVFCVFAGGPIAGAVVGHTSTDQFPYAADYNYKPVGPWTRVPVSESLTSDENGDILPPPKGTATTLLVLGADSVLGRDEMLRLLDGGRTSLEVAIFAVFVSLLVGVPLGILGGYFGGFTDGVISRLTEAVMAFPLILFLVFASVRLSNTLTPIGYGALVPEGVVAVSVLIGLFTWFYPARLVRAEMITLRSAEFVQAARMVGASNRRIVRRHLLPHLIPGLLVWAAIAIAANILLEVGISFVGVGVRAPTPTWGSMLSTTWGTIFQPRTYNAASYTPWQTVLPTVAILLTVVALNQLAEGIRHALEPWSAR